MKVLRNGRGGRVVRSLPRAADQVRSLLAAGTPIAANYEMTQGSPGERIFYEVALGKSYAEFGGSSWPHEGALQDIGEVLVRDGESGVFLLTDGTLVYAHSGHGWFSLRVSAPTREQTAAAVTAFAELYPPTYRQENDRNEVPITFWTYGQYGPQSRLRMIDAASWAEVEGNYSSGVREQLANLMDGFEPGKSGQLLLWQGPPGTGKTWALRALASEWRSWAEFNYITDPDAFFVTKPDYLVDVLLHDSYEELAVIDDEEAVVSTDRLGKWRVLILEDTGELLAANAKESYGQGLSRLLNVVDGLVGQGLRILVLVTTNDELGELHPAVKRPGRCASQIEFDALSAEDASEWLGEETDEGGTLAELYARLGEGEDALAAAAETPAAEPEPEVEPEHDPEPEAAERWDRIVREVEEDEPEPVLASLEQTSAAPEAFAMMRLAAAEVEAARTREFAALQAAQTRDQGILREVLGALRALAIKPSGDTHVTVPTELRPHVTIHEPDITVEPSPAPDVSVQVEPPAVTVEAAAPAPAPDVHVAAPEVHVTVEASAPERRPIRATKAEDGTTTFEVVEDE